jgi:hypothetical protein
MDAEHHQRKTIGAFAVAAALLAALLLYLLNKPIRSEHVL